MRAPPRALDAIADRVRELVAVRHTEGGDADAAGHADRAVELERAPLDVAERDELAPRPVGCRNSSIRAGGVDRHAARVDRLAAQVHQARVVADVRVRQEDAVRQAGRRSALHCALKSGVASKRNARPAGAIDEPEARHVLGAPLPPRESTRRGLMAVELRDAGVLGDAQHDDLPVVAGLRTSTRAATTPTVITITSDADGIGEQAKPGIRARSESAS